MFKKFPAQLWQGFYRAQYRISIWLARHGYVFVPAIFVSLIALSFLFSPSLHRFLDPYLSNPTQNNLANLRSLFLNLGSALIGASAIAFSLVVFAMQVNVERLPHGLFRRFSTDTRIVASFAGTFLVAISIACASLIPDISWAAEAALGSAWGVVLIFGLFLSAYRRALVLINPLQQLNLIVKDADREMQAWVRRAKRVTPLLKGVDSDKDTNAVPPRTTHDLPRITYFQVNPQWTDQAQRAIIHSMSFAQRYAEQGDHEVSAAALNAVVTINRHYVNAKGKTFFAHAWLVDNPLTNDGFINNTLELLRQHLRGGISRGDERQTEQTLRAMAMLVGVYAEIDYSTDTASKSHALLAAGYLSEGVKAVVPHDMPDVLMEGVRLMGKSANLFLDCGHPDSIVTMVENIAMLGCTGCANEKFRPVTLTAMEQLAGLTVNLIQTNARDIHFAIGEIRDNIAMVVKLFLKVPDTPLQRTHSTFLAPCYSSTSVQSLLSGLRELANALLDVDSEDDAADRVIGNIEMWADGLYQSQKELLLLAIEKRSGFTFDIIHWIASVTEILLALSNSPACDHNTRDELRKHALWLIYVIDWIPDDEKTIKFVEAYQPAEVLFEASLSAHDRDCPDISREIQKLLMRWAFKCGKYQTGWATLEQAIYGLATLALMTDDQQEVDGLKQQLAERLSHDAAPSQTLRDRAARDIRREAETIGGHGFATRPIERHMKQLDQETLRILLLELANLLSPETADEPVRTVF